MLRVLIAASSALLKATNPSSQRSEQSHLQLAKPLTLTQVSTLNATYSDETHGVTFRYPTVWEATTQPATSPAALILSDEVKPIEGFRFDEGGFPRNRIVGPYSGTQLEAVGIVYATLPAASVAACETTAASIPGGA